MIIDKLKAIKSFAMRYPLVLPAVYAVFYFPAFSYLQNRVVTHYTIHCIIDQWMPFIPIFVIPYICWFVLVPSVMLYLMLRDRDKYFELCIVLAICMTTALIIYFFFPNQIAIRQHLPDNALMCRLISTVRGSDPACNVCPSIHVANTTAVCLVASKSRAVTDHKVAWYGIATLSFLIIISTTFIDQHSVIDIAAGFILAIIAYIATRRLNARLDR